MKHFIYFYFEGFGAVETIHIAKQTVGNLSLLCCWQIWGKERNIDWRGGRGNINQQRVTGNNNTAIQRELLLSFAGSSR